MAIIDSQIHIYDRDTADFPWSAEAPGIVARVKQLGIPFADAVTAEAAIAEMDAAGVDGAILVNFGGVYDFDNSYALAAAARHPGRFALVGRLDPASPTVEADVAAFAAQPGAVGLRVLAHLHYNAGLAAGDYDRMFGAIQAAGLALCIYAPESPEGLHRVAEAFPSLQIVLDHMCLKQQPPYTLATDPFEDLPKVLELARHPNIAGKLSGMATMSREPYPFADVWPAIHRMVEAFGPQRLMWGTDTTRTSLAYRQELAFFSASNELPQTAKAMILGGALEKIFKWSPRR